MAKSGQPAGFYGGNEWEMGFQSYPNTGTGCESIDSFSVSELLASPENPTMETVFNSQRCGPLAGRIHGTDFPDRTNMNVQRTDTFDSQQHGQLQPVGISCQIGFSEQPSSDIDAPRTVTLRLTEDPAEKRKKSNKAYRERKKKQFTDMQGKLGEFQEENENLRREIADLKREKNILNDKSEMMNVLRGDVNKLKQKHKNEKAFERQLLKINDLGKFIEEGYKCYEKPTQNPFASDEERHSYKSIEEESKEHNELNGDDSGDENDSKKRKKHAAHSARSGHSGKVPRVEYMDDELMGTAQFTSAAKKGSTSNQTASWDNDPYSIPECIHILESMEGIPTSTAMKAITKFESSDQRQIFVSLKEDWRREWVKKLEEA